MRKLSVFIKTALCLLLCSFCVPVLGNNMEAYLADDGRLDVINEEQPSKGVQLLAGEKTIVASGECGENCNWRADEAGTLTISGTGEMYDYGIMKYGGIFVPSKDGRGATPWIKSGNTGKMTTILCLQFCSNQQVSNGTIKEKTCCI